MCAFLWLLCSPQYLLFFPAPLPNAASAVRFATRTSHASGTLTSPVKPGSADRRSVSRGACVPTPPLPLLLRVNARVSLALSSSPCSLPASSYVDAELNALMRRGCSNASGTLLLRSEYHGAITRVLLSVRQVRREAEGGG
jgi:hypothetical protein